MEWKPSFHPGCIGLEYGLMRLSAFAVLFVAGGCFAQAETEASKVYNSPDGEYVVEYPASWNHYPEATSLYILSFPLTRDSLTRERRDDHFREDAASNKISGRMDR
jgi:hypothetical protein